ncbi:MAG: hypothetical protein IJ215_02645 [Clostridia bacterium]|nr:hypothetical protein [Clostridia bacterium]
MSEKSFWSIFRRNPRAAENTSISQRENSTPATENSDISLEQVVNFVMELQSYYYNDICKMQTDLLVHAGWPENKLAYIHQKMQQEQVALSEIEKILSSINEIERDYQEVWRKSVYSFYDDIEKSKLKTVRMKVFEVIVRLCAVNTKPELDEVIAKRIEMYRVNWEISNEVAIPKNVNVILVDETNGIYDYRFGSFQKRVDASSEIYALSAEKLEEIRNITFEYEKEISTESVWVRVASISRLELNYMKKTCMLDIHWESGSDNQSDLFFDIVPKKELEQYLKGVLQIAFRQRRYAVISMLIPKRKILEVIGNTEIDDEAKRVKICKKYRFILGERSDKYSGNLMTARIDRRRIPDIVRLISYPKFKKEYFG